MSEPITPHNLEEHLTAFSDGELDAAIHPALFRYLQEQPEALRRLEQEQHLRLAARRLVEGSAPGPSGELRARIEALEVDEDEPSADGRVTPTSSPGRRRRSVARWLAGPLAAAALLGLGFVWGRHLVSPVGVVVAPPPPAELAIASDVTSVHVDCSGIASRLHDAGFPADRPQLQAAVTRAFGGAQPHPDLSAAGYAIVGAGPCRHPLEDTVHLLYRATGEEARDTVSVFVRPDRGDAVMEPGRAYELRGVAHPHPVFAWRKGGVRFFLVADGIDPARRVLAALGIPAAERTLRSATPPAAT